MANATAADEIFDVVVVGGGPARARRRPTIWRARPQGGAARQGGPHQALRRRDPAAADLRLRHSRTTCSRRA